MRILFVFACLAGYLEVGAQVDAVVPFTSSNLPIVVINTDGQSIMDEPKITATMGIIDNGAARNNVSDPYNNYDGKIGIEIRGSSSQMFPKKQYGIELRDELGEGVASSLLSLPEEEDWILFAPYNDKSLMRDALAYTLGRSLGGYAPRTKFCELVLNGAYQGVYVLIEKIKRDKNRVDINKLDPDEITGNNVTGGYILKIDKTTGGTGEGWVSTHKPPNASNQQILFQYEYPSAEDIVAEQKAYIQKYVTDFENALASDNFTDAVLGYTKFIDVNSFVDFLIMQELTKNVDGYRLSTFFYKQRESDGGKLVMGPVWDFNLGFGNANYCTGGDPNGFVLDFNSICAQDFWLIPFWWQRLLADEVFSSKVAERWAELRATKFKEEVIHGYIDSVATVLNAESQQRNFQAWAVLNKYVWPNYFIGATFHGEVDWLKGWVSARLVWLDQHMPFLVTATEQPLKTGEYVLAYPNPFSTSVNIDYKILNNEPVTVNVYDALGRTVKSAKLNHDSGGTYTYVWQSPNSDGIFYYSLQQGSKNIGKGKLVRSNFH